MDVIAYLRKSTDQNMSEEQQSVTRQRQLAEAFAAGRGWRLVEVFSDDGISGAEFEQRPGLVRLLAALRPRPAFQAVLLYDRDRLGREQIETGYVAKQILRANVRIYETKTGGREITLDSPQDKVLLAIGSFADQLEREKAAVRSRDALVMRARRGAAVGGLLFGYTQARVLGADGQPAHVERSVDPEPARTIVRIFELAAAGAGFKAIAKTLNADAVGSPRPSQPQRSRSWSSTSVRAILFNPHYTGKLLYGRTKKRDAWGQKRESDRPEAEWIEHRREDLRIVSDELWRAAHARIAASRAVFKAAFTGRAHGRPCTGMDSPYLLSGLLECAQCGGSLVIGSRRGAQSRHFAYVCAYHRERGDTVCTNALHAPMVAADTAILDACARELFHPDVVGGLVEEVMAALVPSDGGKAERQRTSARWDRSSASYSATRRRSRRTGRWSR